MYDADSMFQQAASVAAMGWKLVKLWGVRDDYTCTCGKESCPTPGKHPSGGSGWQHRATDQEDEIARWFEAARDNENARCNIGLRLGAMSGVIDVEFDTPEAEQVLKEYGLHLIDTPAYSSGRGVHRLFIHEDWMPESAVVKVKGLEVRIGGGEMASQSVIPPSMHRSGKAYSWLPGKSPEEVPPARLPDAFRDAVLSSSRRQGGGVVAQSCEALRSGEKISEGGRHAFLVGQASKYAARIRDFSDNERAELVGLLTALNITRCNPPKSQAEVTKIASDQFAHYRDKQVERRARRPYEGYGLVWNSEDRCWEPGSWRMTVVHSDPRVYKLWIPNETDSSKPPYVVHLDSGTFHNARQTAQRILEVTGRINMHNPSPGRWQNVWVGSTEQDENQQWMTIQGLSARLLEDSDDEFPPPEQKASCNNFSILLSYLSDFQKVETSDNDEPNQSGAPRWVLRDGQWQLWLQWRVTVNAAWRKAGLPPPTRSESNKMLDSIRAAVAPYVCKKANHKFKDGRQLHACVFFEDIEIAAMRALSGEGAS